MTNGNAYSLLIAYSILANNDIKGIPFGVQRLANRNFKALYSIEEERQAIGQAEDKTEEEKNEAWQDFLALPFRSNIELLDENKIEDVLNQSLPSGATTAQVFNTILDLQTK